MKDDADARMHFVLGVRHKQLLRDLAEATHEGNLSQFVRDLLDQEAVKQGIPPLNRQYQYNRKMSRQPVANGYVKLLIGEYRPLMNALRGQTSRTEYLRQLLRQCARERGIKFER